MSTLIVGVDPGQTTGVCSFITDRPADSAIGVQIHNVDGLGVIDYVTSLLRREIDAGRTDSEPRLAVEKFVVGHRAARSRHSNAGEVTRGLVYELEALGRNLQVVTYVRPAATVKPWATDERLAAAGLLAACVGMGHARDAARHALYAAVRAGLVRDPLSRKEVSR